MFTGIVQNTARLKEVERIGPDAKLLIEASLSVKDFTLGNSIAVNGVCLTVENYNALEKTFSCTAVEETLSRTTLGFAEEGDLLNLEAPVTMETPLAGHLVSGHVDGLAEVLEPGAHFRVKLPLELLRFCPQKGSLAINGVSLTIVEQEGDELELALIPETLNKTNLGRIKKGDRVNIEVDMIARYLDKLNKS